MVLAPAAEATGGHRAASRPTRCSCGPCEGEFDAVLAPYHDVGMTAIKVASFGQAVNVTLGLPFPRTSPGSRNGDGHRREGDRGCVEYAGGDRNGDSVGLEEGCGGPKGLRG